VGRAVGRVASLAEEALIERVRRRCGDAAPGPPDGIGDDAARVRPRRGWDLVWTADLLVEGVHFRERWTPPRLLGRKALAVNFSDVAAMAARPRAFLLALALPPSTPVDWLDRFAGGVAGAARDIGAQCVGGDTTAARRGLLVSVTAIGEVRPGRLLTRSAARPGDGLWVSGPLGASALGLKLLRAGWTPGGSRRHRGLPDRAARRAVRAHLDPRPPLALGPWLARRGTSRAAIDLSDGLSTDLPRLCRASGVGARIDRPALPLDPSVRAWARWKGADGEALALHGGEDYALLFAVPRRREGDLRYLLPGTGARPVRIGEVVDAAQGIRLRLADGSERSMRPRGFEHFGGGGRS